MPALVAQRLGEGLAERDRDVLHRVVGVDVQVAVGLHGEVDAAVLGQRGEHVVVEPHAGADRGRPGAVEVQLDDELGLAGGPLDACSAAHAVSLPEWAVVRRDLTQGGEESVGLLRRAGRDPEPAGQPDVAHQDAAVEQRLPRGVRVGEVPEQHEVGVAGDAGQAHARQRGHDPVALLLHRVHGGQQRIGVGERGARGGLGERAEVVRQPHQLQRVHHGLVGGEVAQPQAGHPERLAHGAADDQPRPAGQQGERRRRPGAGELRVRLVDDDHAAGRVVDRR